MILVVKLSLVLLRLIDEFLYQIVCGLQVAVDSSDEFHELIRQSPAYLEATDEIVGVAG